MSRAEELTEEQWAVIEHMFPELRRIRRQIPILDVWDFARAKESPPDRRRLQMSTRWFNNADETRQ